MKLLLVISSVFFVISLVDSKPAQAGLLAASAEHNLYECDPSRANLKVLERTIQKTGRAGRIIQSDIQFPQIGLYSRPITCIIVQDLSRGGKGGYVDIIAGGVNYKFVSLSLDSQYGEDLHFSVSLYTDYAGNTLPYGGQVPSENDKV